MKGGERKIRLICLSSDAKPKTAKQGVAHFLNYQTGTHVLYTKSIVQYEKSQKRQQVRDSGNGVCNIYLRKSTLGDLTVNTLEIARVSNLSFHVILFGVRSSEY